MIGVGYEKVELYVDDAEKLGKMAVCLGNTTIAAIVSELIENYWTDYMRDVAVDQDDLDEVEEW